MVINFSNIGSGSGGGEYHLPTATASRLGGVKIGEGVNVAADGTISVTGSASYEAGEHIDITEGVISATNVVDATEYLEAQEVISEALNDLNTRMGEVNNALNLI